MKRQLALLGALALVVLTPPPSRACGGAVAEAIFSFAQRPDEPLADWSAGRLGIVRPTLRDTFRVVAYRWLSGLPLSAEEQVEATAAFALEYEDSDLDVEAIDAWTEARLAVGAKHAARLETERTVDGGIVRVTVCGNHAVRLATQTLNERARTWGAASPWTQDWVRAQEAVFLACSSRGSTRPDEAPSGAPRLLQADRAYQIAAWRLYQGGQLEEAVEDFTAIARNTSSPWRPWGTYLAARARLQLHSRSPLPDAELAASEQALLDEVARPGPTRGHQRAMLEAVRWRRETTHLPRLSREVVTPGALFRNVLRDYTIARDREGPTTDDLGDWLDNLRVDSRGPMAEAAGRHALDRWRATRTSAWLVAALQRVDPEWRDSDADLDALAEGRPTLPSPDLGDVADMRAAAAAVPPGDPSWPTVTWRRARLALRDGDKYGARALADAALAAGLPSSAHNDFARMRARLSTDAADLAGRLALHPIGERWSGGWEYARPVTADERVLDAWGARAWTFALPSSTAQALLPTFARAPALHVALLRSTWARAVLLGDDHVILTLAAELRDRDPALAPAASRVLAEPDAEQRRFLGAWTLLWFPGVSPVPPEGALPKTNPGEGDRIRGNGWCSLDDAPPTLTWLSEAERATAAEERARLAASGSATTALGGIVIAHVEAHPRDPLNAEALARVVWMSRFGCGTRGATSRAAHGLLHARYPRSRHALATKYWYAE